MSNANSNSLSDGKNLLENKEIKPILDATPSAQLNQRNLPIVDDIFKGKSMTFEELTKLNYKQFNTGKEPEFKPSDILDMNDIDSDDEILSKFKAKKKSLKSFIPGSHRKASGSIGTQLTPISGGVDIAQIKNQVMGLPPTIN